MSDNQTPRGVVSSQQNERQKTTLSRRAVTKDVVMVAINTDGWKPAGPYPSGTRRVVKLTKKGLPSFYYYFNPPASPEELEWLSDLPDAYNYMHPKTPNALSWDAATQKIVDNEKPEKAKAKGTTDIKTKTTITTNNLSAQDLLDPLFPFNILDSDKRTTVVDLALQNRWLTKICMKAGMATLFASFQFRGFPQGKFISSLTDWEHDTAGLEAHINDFLESAATMNAAIEQENKLKVDVAALKTTVDELEGRVEYWQNLYREKLNELRLAVNSMCEADIEKLASKMVVDKALRSTPQQ